MPIKPYIFPKITSKRVSERDANLGYSLYKPEIRGHRQRPTLSHDNIIFEKNWKPHYPNSLVEMVEDLEVSSECEDRYSEKPLGCSTLEGRGHIDYDSDDEESTVIDNIFFLKR